MVEVGAGPASCRPGGWPPPGASALLDHSDPEVQRQANQLVKQCDRITKVVEQLLSFGRRKPAIVGPCDLTTPITAVLELSQAKLPPSIIAVPLSVLRMGTSCLARVRLAMRSSPRRMRGAPAGVADRPLDQTAVTEREQPHVELDVSDPARALAERCPGPVDDELDGHALAHRRQHRNGEFIRADAPRRCHRACHAGGGGGRALEGRAGKYHGA